MKYIFILIGLILPQIAAAQTPEIKASEHLLNPLGDTSGGAPELAARLIRTLLGFAGVAALALFIWGGLTLLMSRGNPEKVKAGRDTLIWAIIGLVVAFSSYIILRFVIEAVITPTA